MEAEATRAVAMRESFMVDSRTSGEVILGTGDAVKCLLCGFTYYQRLRPAFIVLH